VVADVALQPADATGSMLRLDEHTLRLALALLRADPPTHRREGAGLVDGGQRAVHVAHQQLADEGRDVDAHRAAGDAGGLDALDAALGLAQRLAPGE
jgi:hypothetical protein